jgi:hypothetical protein
MTDWIPGFLQDFHLSWGNAFLGVGIFLATFTVSLAVSALVVVRLPATYFCKHCPPTSWRARHPALRWSFLLGKNLLGLGLVVLGVLLSLPGVPGQGILTILIGVMLLDFPGKRALERKLVARPAVRRTIDRLRVRFGRPPLVLDDSEGVVQPIGGSASRR